MAQFMGSSSRLLQANVASSLSHPGRGTVTFTADGVVKFANNAGTGFNYLNLNGPRLTRISDTNIAFQTSTGTPATTSAGSFGVQDSSSVPTGYFDGGAAKHLALGSDWAIKFYSAATGFATNDLQMTRAAAGVLQINNGTAATGGALEIFEATAPSAPAANGVRIYAVDNGGKTELLALFSSGAAIRLAIQV